MEWCDHFHKALVAANETRNTSNTLLDRAGGALKGERPGERPGEDEEEAVLVGLEHGTTESELANGRLHLAVRTERFPFLGTGHEAENTHVELHLHHDTRAARHGSITRMYVHEAKWEGAAVLIHLVDDRTGAVFGASKISLTRVGFGQPVRYNVKVRLTGTVDGYG